MIKHRSSIIIVALYFISYGLILMNNGLYWDDWDLINYTKNELFTVFSSMGNVETYYLHNYLLFGLHSLYIYKVIVFVSFLTTTLIFNEILSKMNEINDYSRFFIVALFSQFPISSTRIAIITTPGTIKNLLFYVGAYLFVMCIKKRSLLLRVLALLSFYLSFTLNSTLTLYLVVLPILLLYFGRESGAALKYDRIRYADFISAPFIFLVIKKIYLSPYGTNVGYNHFDLASMLNAVKMLIVPFYTTLIEVLLVSLNNFSGIYVISALILAALIGRNEKAWEYNIFYKRMFACGILLFAASIFPYLSVDKLPTFSDWNGRFQILTPLGASIIIYCLLRLLMEKAKIEKGFQHLVLCLILVSFVGMNVKSYYLYKRDWYKQLSIMENLRSDENVINIKEVAFVDRTTALNVNSRTYRLYEYQGVLNRVFGKGVKHAVRPSETDRGKGSVHNNGDVLTIAIDYGDYDLNISHMVRLMLRELFTTEYFIINIKRAVHFAVI